MTKDNLSPRAKQLLAAKNAAHRAWKDAIKNRDVFPKHSATWFKLDVIVRKKKADFDKAHAAWGRRDRPH